MTELRDTLYIVAFGLFMQILSFTAVVLASANVVGGFVVTDRMLEMFKKRPDERE